ncbi:MAG: hypothetical protein V3V97_00845 [Hyphomicrobiaceae bacterium]
MDAMPLSVPVEERPDDLPRAFARSAAREDTHAPAHDSSVLVAGVDIPFTRLATFFLKTALAAVPALFLFGVIIFGMCELLTTMFPTLLKLKILIYMPS